MSIEQSYNSWAKQYDTNDNKTRDLDIKSTIDTLSNYSFSSVLEIGCGTGKNTGWFLNRAEHVTGLDFSEEMLKIARGKITDDRVKFIKTDLTKAWDIENQMADLVTANLTLEHIENLDHVFNQANQKLVSGGLFFISELHPAKQYMGSKAKYEADSGTVELTVYTHHFSDYMESATNNGFEILEVKEWFDEVDKRTVPRLISFLLKKRKLAFP